MSSYNSQSNDQQSNKSFLDNFSPKAAFFGGLISAFLIIGTLGFIFLGSCMLKGSCPLTNNEQVANAPTNDQGTKPTTNNQKAEVPAINDNDYILGNPDAPVTVIEYSDIQCPFCSRFHPNAQKVVDAYKGQVRWVFRHFPLVSIHPNAEPAANAIECAGEQDKFYEFINIMYENQKSLSTDFYSQTAKKLGLNVKKFDDCVSSNKYIDKVREEAQGGLSAGVNGTPGSFVIGQDGGVTPIKGALPFESVKQTIDSVLKK